MRVPTPLRGGTRRAPLDAHQLTLAWQSASLLLGYPDPQLPDHLELVGRAARELPPRVADPLRATADRLAAAPLGELEADYVETFDSRRRHSLFLTYFAHGDTRQRGVALLRFKQTYLAAGVDLDASGGAGPELPDHLCVVLEYAATVDQPSGLRLLVDHRAGLEVLRLALAEDGSRWAGAVEAVTATLPALRGSDVDAIRRLAAQGPPEEEVGLTPYASPGSPTLLPMPTFPGGR
jgi:nitrate reductase delta subunit